MKKERFVILDAMRAIAGLTVPLFHIFENLGRLPAKYESWCGHGYLAVEFFLLLMGYMLAYAYDRRWEEGMSLWGFFRRRLVRLHPLVISGVLLGLAVYFLQGAFGEVWLGRWSATMPAWQVLLYALWAMTMVPVVGCGGMINPFNACSWTLYYEYAGNILYALGLRKLGKRVLLGCALVALFFWVCFVMHVNLNGIFGTHVALFDKVASPKMRWSIVCGWQDVAWHVYGAFVRLALPLFLGLLLARLKWRITLKKGALGLAVLVFVGVLYTPFTYRLGGPGHYWVNALFEILAVTVVFPALILVGVGNRVDPASRLARVLAFFAELSYPLYMSHFMFIGLFYSWVSAFAKTHGTAAVFAGSFVFYLLLIALACLVMRFWDRPIQKWLTKGR